MSGDDGHNDASPFVKSNESPLTASCVNDSASSAKQDRDANDNPLCGSIIISDPKPQHDDLFSEDSVNYTVDGDERLEVVALHQHSETRSDPDGSSTPQSPRLSLEEEGEWADPEHESKRVKVLVFDSNQNILTLGLSGL